MLSPSSTNHDMKHFFWIRTPPLKNHLTRVILAAVTFFGWWVFCDPFRGPDLNDPNLQRLGGRSKGSRRRLNHLTWLGFLHFVSMEFFPKPNEFKKGTDQIQKTYHRNRVEEPKFFTQKKRNMKKLWNELPKLVTFVLLFPTFCLATQWVWRCVFFWGTKNWWSLKFLDRKP